MFRSSMRSSSGSSLFTTLSMLLILKIIKTIKKCYHPSWVMWQRTFIMPVMLTVWRRELESSSRLHTVYDIRLLKVNVSVSENIVSNKKPIRSICSDVIDNNRFPEQLIHSAPMLLFSFQGSISTARLCLEPPDSYRLVMRIETVRSYQLNKIA